MARHFIDVAKAGIPGWRIVFLTPEGPLVQALRDVGAEVVSGRFGPEAGLAASWRTLRKVIKHYRPDVVHTHLSYADFVAALASPWRGPVLVTTEHGIADDDLVYHGSAWKSRLMASAHHLRLRRFSLAIAVSHETKRVMKRKWRPKPPILVVPNGVARRAHPAPRPGLRLASIARLSPEKRIDVTLEVFAKLRQRQPQATLTIAGEGPLEDELRAQAKSLGLGDSVRFVGHVPPEQVLDTSDVVVQLSVFENCSYTLLDALASGLGVCATHVGGNPEILPDRCLANADDTEALVEIIVRQGLELPQRPQLGDWPNTIGMGKNLAGVYNGRALGGA